MFNQTFYNRIETILSHLAELDIVSMRDMSGSLAELIRCLNEAEVEDAIQTQFADMVLDQVAAAPGRNGAQLACELRDLIDELPGVSSRGDDTSWVAGPPAALSQNGAATRWDIKELDNRLSTANRASLDSLRRLLGLTSERRIHGAVDLRHRRRFEACCGMKMGDRHDAGIDEEQINRLIRYLGWGNGGFGGRPAVLG